MKLWLETDKRNYRLGESVTVRLMALNDGYQPVEIDRLALIGPNPVVERPTGMPWPVSVEPSMPPPANNRVALNPFCIYGRQRTFDQLPAGKVVFHAYLLRSPSERLLPERPADPAVLDFAAEPLVVDIAAPPSGP